MCSLLWRLRAAAACRSSEACFVETEQRWDTCSDTELCSSTRKP